MSRTPLLVLWALVAFVMPARAATLEDIIGLAKMGLSDDRILTALTHDPPDFPVDPRAVQALRRGGLSDQVIETLRLRQVRNGLEVQTPSESLERLKAKPNGISALDVLDLQLSGASDRDIIATLEARDALFPLLAADLRQLGAAGMRPAVLNAIAARLSAGGSRPGAVAAAPSAPARLTERRGAKPASVTSLSDVLALHRAGASSQDIIEAIEQADLRFTLLPEALAHLENQGMPAAAVAVIRSRNTAKPSMSSPILSRRDESSVERHQPSTVRVTETDAGGGHGIGVSVQLESAEVRRKAWAQRGGSIGSAALSAGLTFMSMSFEGFESTGFGGVVAFDYSRLSLSPPVPEEKTMWTAFRYGVGASLSFLTMSSYSEYYDEEMSSSSGSLELRGLIGILLGLGGFNLDNVWRGVALGLSWRPTYQIPFDGEPSFNFLGFALDLDVASFENAVKSVASEAHFRIGLFLLPPIDNLPFVLSISIGAVWY